MKMNLKNCRKQTMLSHLQIGINKSLSDLDFSKIDLFLEKPDGYKFFKRNSLSKLDILVLYWNWIYNTSKDTSEYIKAPFDFKIILPDFLTFAETDEFCKNFLEKNLEKNWKSNIRDVLVLYDISKNLIKVIRPKVSKEIKSLKGYKLYTYVDKVVDKSTSSFERKQKLEKYKFNWISNHIILNDKFNTKFWVDGIYLEKLSALFKPKTAATKEKYLYDYLTYLGLKNYFFNENLINRRHNVHDIWETRKVYKKLIDIYALDYEKEAIKKTIEHWAKVKGDIYLSYNPIYKKWGRWSLEIDDDGNQDEIFDDRFYTEDEIAEITTFEAEEKNAIETQAPYTIKNLKEKALKLYSNLELAGLLNEDI